MTDTTTDPIATPEPPIALVDLDGTLVDYDGVMRIEQERLRSPHEPPYVAQLTAEGDRTQHPAYLEARRRLIQSKPGFWRNLPPLRAGTEIVEMLRTAGYQLNILTKGPRSVPSAWMEKVEWVTAAFRDLPELPAISIVTDKSRHYGRVLVDDWPAYFLPWLARRPRGLVVTPAQPWNASYALGQRDAHPRVFRYEGALDRERLQTLLIEVAGRRG